MDSQIASHGSSYAYSSPHWPEFYDLWVAQLFGTTSDSDAPVFASLFTPLLQLPPPIDVTIVDVGTGTGRVIKNLYKTLAAHPTDTDAAISFIGFDNGQSMLDRAERTFNTDVAAAFPVSSNVNVKTAWKVASASNFMNELGLRDSSVDLVLFAAGAIGHLTDDQEVEAFLAEVARGLRPTGKAVISVLNDMIQTPSSKKNEDKADEFEFEAPMKIKSLETAGLMYIKSPTERKVEGDLMTETFSVKGVNVDQDGHISESSPLWTHDLSWSLRYFDEVKWKAAVQHAGLLIDRVEDGGFQRWYVLGVKLVMEG